MFKSLLTPLPAIPLSTRFQWINICGRRALSAWGENKWTGCGAVSAGFTFWLVTSLSTSCPSVGWLISWLVEQWVGNFVSLSRFPKKLLPSNYSFVSGFCFPCTIVVLSAESPVGITVVQHRRDGGAVQGSPLEPQPNMEHGWPRNIIVMIGVFFLSFFVGCISKSFPFFRNRLTNWPEGFLINPKSKHVI